jgi:hypothetical protein
LHDWQRVQRIDATALVTSYDSGGLQTVDRVKLSMDFRSGEIRAHGQSTLGPWSAQADRRGGCTGSGPAGVCRNMKIILHRSAGPLNLLYGDKVGAVRWARVSGQDVVRVGAQGQDKAPLAYYFDTTTSMLRFLTSGGDAPGARGTVTIYGPKESYVMLPDGLVFPRTFRLVKIGRDTLVGEQPVLEVEFSDIRIR